MAAAETGTKEAESSEGVWFFGYGSLVWRPNLEHSAAVHGYAEHWRRRFWQGSPEHRGTPSSLGRVVTLLSDTAHAPILEQAPHEGDANRVHGTLFFVPRRLLDAMMERLLIREQAGYDMVELSVTTCKGTEEFPAAAEAGGLPRPTEIPEVVQARCFIAAPDKARNEFFLGPASMEDIAATIRDSRGESGPNIEYFERLRAAMKARRVVDPHLEGIALALGGQGEERAQPSAGSGLP